MAIKINSQCIRNKHHWSNCHLCSSVCNLNAITFEPQIHVDINKCNQCGRCVEACPFGAIEGKKASYNVRENTLYEDNQYPPTFEKLLLIKAKGINSICMVSLTWQQYMEEVNTLLASNNISTFKIIHSTEKKDEISHSRRSLLRFTQISNRIESDINEKVNLSKFYPQHQLYRIKFESAKCNLCTLCETHCPEKCIKIEYDRMILEGRKCNGCNLCADVCVTKSISIEKELHESKLSIHSVYQCTCSGCGLPYKVIDNSVRKLRLCTACQFRKNNEIPIYEIGMAGR